MALIRIKDLYKSYVTGGEETRVLLGLDMDVDAGEMIMIMGPSGSGKTTLLNLLGGIDSDYKGHIFVGTVDLESLGPGQLTEFRRDKVGFIFQFYNLIPTLTAVENVELGMEALVKDKKELRRKAEHYLDLVGLKDKLNNFPQELSGGEQQRVAIARALAKEPKLILADEPTGNVDEERERSIMTLMKKLRKELSMTFIIVSHNSRLRAYMDKTLSLRHGKLRELKSSEGA